MRSHALLPFLVGFSFVAPATHSTLSAEPVTAHVVDADTGAPLAGVAVAAYWELHEGSLTGHSLGCGAIDMEGAVTDAKGEFHIRGWGPITVSGSCDMRTDNPSLILFKPGYLYLGMDNNPPNPLGTVLVSRSNHDGDTIKLHKAPDMDLKKPRSDLDGYAWDFSTLNRVIGRYASEGCNWKKIPDMLRAIYIQDQGFIAAYQQLDTVTAHLIRDDAEWQKAAPQCGSPKAFIEGLVK
ncbi:MAG TPA: hypothetical protein VGN70_06380 [Gammaproteobacteria bacterium]|jgi:hypothetical protein